MLAGTAPGHRVNRGPLSVIPPMKLAIGIIVVVVIVAIVAMAVRTRRASAAELTQGETKIRDLVREVYAGNIVCARVTRDGSGAVLIVELRNEKLKELKIDMSSLARKHEQVGLSLPVIKMSLRLD